MRDVSVYYVYFTFYHSRYFNRTNRTGFFDNRTLIEFSLFFKIVISSIEFDKQWPKFEQMLSQSRLLTHFYRTNPAVELRRSNIFVEIVELILLLN